MKSTGSTTTFDWSIQVFRPLVISGMMSCVIAGWVVLFEFFLVGWHGEYLIGLAILATLETLLA